MPSKWKKVDLLDFVPNGVLVNVHDIDEKTGKPIGSQVISHSEWFRNINRWKDRKILTYEMNGGG